MSKKLVLPVLGLLIVGIGALAYTRRSSSPAPAAPADQTMQQTVSEANEFAKAVESGKPTACTVVKGADKMEYIIQGKKMRANIMANTQTSYMINDTAYIYIWADGQKQGTKMPVPTEEELKSTTEQTSKYKESAPMLSNEDDYNSFKESGYTINCQASTANDTTFIPPADIKFTDVSAMMQAIPSPAADGTIDYKKLQEQYSGMMPRE